VEISTDARAGAALHTLVQTLEDRAVVVNMLTGRCWELNATGVAIWMRLVDGASVAETANAISARYSVPADVATKDVLALVGSLVSEGLLVISTSNGSASAAPR
jgi:Coenzyme PQQ synthesis protein D (PqqD)